MSRVKAMFEDFTAISCGLCSKICGQKNCAVHRKGCMKRNLYTAEELVKKGWVKRENSEEVTDFCLITTKDRDDLLKAIASDDTDNVREIAERLKRDI